MKKCLTIYVCSFLLASLMSTNLFAQASFEDIRVPVTKRNTQSKSTYSLPQKSNCESCFDKVLLDLKKKDTLSIEEMKVYSTMMLACENCKSSNYQIDAINRQTRAILEKPSAASPLWVMATITILGIFATVYAIK